MGRVWLGATPDADPPPTGAGPERIAPPRAVARQPAQQHGRPSRNGGHPAPTGRDRARWRNWFARR